MLLLQLCQFCSRQPHSKVTKLTIKLTVGIMSSHCINLPTWPKVCQYSPLSQPSPAGSIPSSTHNTGSNKSILPNHHSLGLTTLGSSPICSTRDMLMHLDHNKAMFSNSSSPLVLSNLPLSLLANTL